MSLVPALWSYFSICPCTSFCLAIVPALCKKFAIGPSVKFVFKKKGKTNSVPRGPIITRHMGH